VTSLTLDKITFQELININNNLYLPLKTFNSLNDFKSICSKMKLSNSKFFPIPILHGISKLQKEKIKKFNKIKLLYRKKKITSKISINHYVGIFENVKKRYKN